MTIDENRDKKLNIGEKLLKRSYIIPLLDVFVQNNDSVLTSGGATLMAKVMVNGVLVFDEANQ